MAKKNQFADLVAILSNLNQYRDELEDYYEVVMACLIEPANLYM